MIGLKLVRLVGWSTAIMQKPNIASQMRLPGFVPFYIFYSTLRLAGCSFSAES